MTNKKMITSALLACLCTFTYNASYGADITSQSFKTTQDMLRTMSVNMEQQAAAYEAAAAVEAPASIRYGVYQAPTDRTVVRPTGTTNMADIVQSNPSSVYGSTPDAQADIADVVKATPAIASDAGTNEYIPVTKMGKAQAAEAVEQAPVTPTIQQGTVPTDWESAFQSAYQTNLDMTVGNKTYTVTLPGTVSTYGIQTKSQYTNLGGTTTTVTQSTVTAETVVQNRPIRVAVSITTPADGAGTISAIPANSAVDVATASKLFAYNELFDGVKNAPFYEYYTTQTPAILLKAGAVTTPNGKSHPYATTLSAVGQDALITATVSSNEPGDASLVKTVAYGAVQQVKERVAKPTA